MYMNSTTANETITPNITSAIYSDEFCRDLGVLSWIYTAVLLLQVVVGLPANIEVIRLLVHEKGGVLTSDVFSVNLAVIDVITCLHTFFYILIYLRSNLPVVRQALHFFYGFFYSDRPFFLCCICVERYLAVVHPIVYLKYKTSRYRLACSASVWLFAIGFCILNMHAQFFTISGIPFLLVLIINTFCSLSILRALIQPRPGDGEREEMNTMKRRAFITVLVIQVMMIVSYMPLLTVIPLTALFGSTYCFCLFYIFSFALLILGNLLHPFFHLSRMGKLPCTKKSRVVKESE